MKALILILVLGFSAAVMAAGECKGMAESCESMGVSSCTLQRNCNVDLVSHQCSGMVIQCHLFSGKGSCEMQRGCRWEEKNQNEPRQKR